MFCPECRKYWDAPHKSDEAKAPRRPVERKRCTVCGSLLAPDRLVAEFPAVQETTQAGRTFRDRRVTVQEILRETAGPSPVDGFKASIETDEQGVRRGWRGLRRFSEPGQANDADWNDSEAPVIPHGFGRPGRPKLPIGVILDMAMLGAIALLIVAVIVHTVVGFSVRPVSGRPRAQVVSAANLGSARASADSLAEQSALPSVIANWNQVAPPTIAGSEAVATYTNLSSLVRVWVQTEASPNAAQTVLARMASGSSSDTHYLAAQRQFLRSPSTPIARMPSVVYDANVPDNAPTGYGSISATPGSSNFAHYRAWVNGSEVITVASDSAPDRDAFASILISQ